MNTPEPVSNHWNAWLGTYDGDKMARIHGTSNQMTRPTPILSDIEFDDSGAMVLGFRDRMGDQLGWEGISPTPGDDELLKYVAGGDLNKACGSGDSYTLDANDPGGDCADNSSVDSEQPDGVNEFYGGEYFGEDHHETAQGGVAYAPGQDMASTVMDPLQLFSGGVGFFDNQSGEGPGNDGEGRGYEVTARSEANSVNGFGKANGLGDLEVLADNAPMELGNRVWYDEDNDGEQDGGEACLPGTAVTLLSADGEELASTETDENCEYFFGGADQPDLIDPDTDYTVQFDACSADTSGVEGSPDPSTLSFTEEDAVDNDRHDSDAVQSGARDCTGEAEVTTPQRQGRAMHTVDAGLTAEETCAIGDYVWSDDNENGVQDEGEAGVEGVEVELLDEDGNPVEEDGEPVTATTDADGMYEFSGIDCGTYTVRFNAPDGQEFTEQEAGDDPETDSNPDPQSGETGPVTVDSDNPEDMTVDAGLVPAKGDCTIGDYVWKDEDGDGVQDDGEPGVGNVTVELLDEDGNPVEEDGEPVTTTTDSDGKYLFDGIECGNYRVKFSDTPNGMAFTEPGAGGDPAKDSDPNRDTGITPVFQVTEDDPEDLTIDAGLVEAKCLGRVGDKVWDDRNSNGIQDSGEPGVPGVTVELLDEEGNVVKTADGEPAQVVTNEDGEYLFTRVPCDTYKVRFSNLPDGTEFTEQGAGDDPSMDSDPNPETGVTAAFDVTAENPKVLTIDAGVVRAGGGPAGGTDLPYTGAEIGLAALVGTALVGAGALLLVTVRRRRSRLTAADGITDSH